MARPQSVMQRCCCLHQFNHPDVAARCVPRMAPPRQPGDPLYSCAPCGEAVQGQLRIDLQSRRA